MARDLVTWLKTVRSLALVQIIIGCLIFIFGIVDLALIDSILPLVRFFYTGIWTGIWFCITGSLGISGSSKERTSCKNALTGVYMGFSITSAVFGGIIIILCSSDLRLHGVNDGAPVIAVFVFMFGIVSFVVGIWAAVGSCYIGTSCCLGSDPAQQETQMAYISNPGMPAGGYDMQQGPGGGVPVAVPVQGGGMVAVQVPTSAAAAGSHPQVVHVPTSIAMGSYPQVPVSGAMAFQPQVAQVSTSGATGGPPQYVQYAGASGAMMGADQSQAEFLQSSEPLKMFGGQLSYC